MYSREANRVERVILHCDANSFYASVECLYRPELRDKPVAVGGDVEARHGIILTKNQIAKRYGVKTGEAIWQAKQKCPDLVCVPPDFALYARFSKRMRALYEEYTSRVESFGLDECWLDLSSPEITFVDGVRIAEEIRLRVREELGITVSVGVSFNKVFAKLGSDYKKPDATTVISRNNYQSIVWPLPVQELLFVGPATRRRLAVLNIRTIGDLACASPALLQNKLGKNGLTLLSYANGWDQSPVMQTDQRASIKSIGNSTTPPHDLTCMDDARCIFTLLAESVAARLRQEGLRARCVSISARNTELVTASCQTMLKRPTSLTDEIARASLQLFSARFAGQFPYRSVGVSCSHLSGDDAPVQLDFTGEAQKRLHMEKLERSIDGLRSRYGHQVIQRGIVLMDSACSKINPVEDHTIHPVPFYTG